jgi:hypothetical protein
MRALVRSALAVPLAILLGACGSSSDDSTVAGPELHDGLAATCSPIRSEGVCMMPFPNAIYEQADSTTKTGLRVALPPETLPVSTATNVPLDTSRYAADGFSPSTPILAYFPERIDQASLPAEASPDDGAKPTSATILLDMDAKQLLPHFAEVDSQAYRPGVDRQSLIIRPMTRLAPGHRYAVAITKSIKTVDGGLPTAPPLFDGIADGHPHDDDMSQKQAARMPEILAALDAAGVHRSDLVVAWDFVTGSDEYLTSHVLSMRDQALAQIGDSGIGYTITSVEDDFDTTILRRIRGTFTVPLFLTNGDRTKPEAQLQLDDSGTPKLLGQYEVPFTIMIPRVVQTKGPLPIVLFGHGLLGSGEGELGDASVTEPATPTAPGGYLQDVAQSKGYIFFATDWTGLSHWEDPLAAGGNGAAGEAIRDFNHLPWVTDRLQQAIVNAIALVRTMRGKIVHDPAMTVTGKAGDPPAADETKLYYYGISLGGIMGGSFMGYDPDVTRGVLGVAGGAWSLLFQRSSNWREFKLVIGASYPDFADEQLLLALAQMQFDFSDPITVTPHTILDPLPNTPKKQILLQMALHDSQVPNVSSELVARTMGLALLAESPVAIWSLSPTAGPLDSAMSVWDPKLEPTPPPGNATPSTDNGAHGAIRVLVDQFDHFFTTGEVVSTCDGPCDPE